MAVMGNLFLKERESWWVWCIWGVIGCVLSAYVLVSTKQQHLAFVVPSLLSVFITVWMSYSKRFEFFRAFKVLLLVVAISCVPSLADIFLPLNELAVAAFKAALVLFFVVILCVICAWLAKRPKQYY